MLDKKILKKILKQALESLKQFFESEAGFLCLMGQRQKEKYEKYALHVPQLICDYF